MEEDKGGHYDCSLSSNGSLSSVTMIPSISRVMYHENESHVITLDGAHTCYSKLKILLAVMKDGNGKLQIVGVRLCVNESVEEYGEFLKDIKKYIVTEDGPNPVIVGDRAKGLISAASEVFGCKIHSCLVHLLRNVDSWTSASSLNAEKRRKVRSIVAQLGKTLDESTAEKLYDELEAISPTIVNRLVGLDSIWCRLMSSELTFGVITNNAAECTNSLLIRSLDFENSVRDACFFDMVVSLYSLIQTQQEIRNSSILAYVKEKNTEFHSYDTITPYVMKKLNRYQSYVSPGIAGAARIRNWKVVGDKVCILKRNMNPYYVINLKERSCTCGMYQLTNYPCIHAIIYLFYHGVSVSPTMINLVHPYYRASSVLKSSDKSLPNLPEMGREEFNRFDDQIRASLTIPQQIASALSSNLPNRAASKRSFGVSFYSKAIHSVSSLEEQVDGLICVEEEQNTNQSYPKRVELENKSSGILSEKKKNVPPRRKGKSEKSRTIASNYTKHKNGEAGPSQGVCIRRNNPIEQNSISKGVKGKGKSRSQKKKRNNVDDDYVPSHWKSYQ